MEKDSIDTYSDCVRGRPERVIDSTLYPNSSFVLINETNAIESVKSPTGDSLFIHHGGCEYYVLKYQYKTSRFSGDSADCRFWLSNAALLLMEFNPANLSPVNLKIASDSIKKYLNAPGIKSFDEPIYLNDSEIMEIFTLKPIRKLSRKSYLVEFEFSIGPL
ncbi:MAG: hypothetical protein GC181_08485 [Bacteroidetes bacterium]|nr:hypothetical protein [Bacteroidota bacterium]